MTPKDRRAHVRDICAAIARDDGATVAEVEAALIEALLHRAAARQCTSVGQEGDDDAIEARSATRRRLVERLTAACDRCLNAADEVASDILDDCKLVPRPMLADDAPITAEEAVTNEAAA